MASPIVKVLGERSTGTNLLVKVLQDHFDVSVMPNSSGIKPEQKALIPGVFEGGWTSRRSTKEAIQDRNHYCELPDTGGWKHAAATPRFYEDFVRPKQAIVLCLVRHPASWLRSMHRNPFHGICHLPKDFGAFVKSPWVAMERDELEDRVLASPVDLLIQKTESYEWLCKQCNSAVVLCYEAFITNPEAVLKHTSVWAFRKQDKVPLPRESARGFGKGNANLDTYTARAKAVRYEQLGPDGKEFVEEKVEGTKLAQLYPV